MVAEGFEPSKRDASDLKSLPFDQTREHYQILQLELISHTGTRTRVGWVKTSYPNHLDYMGL